MSHLPITPQIFRHMGMLSPVHTSSPRRFHPCSSPSSSMLRTRRSSSPSLAPKQSQTKTRAVLLPTQLHESPLRPHVRTVIGYGHGSHLRLGSTWMPLVTHCHTNLKIERLTLSLRCLPIPGTIPLYGHMGVGVCIAMLVVTNEGCRRSSAYRAALIFLHAS